MSINVKNKIKEFYQRTGRVPTVRDCDGNELPKYYTIRRQGGLRRLLYDLGIFENKKPLLIESLVRYYDEHGRWPKARDCQDCEYLKSHGTYVEEFGTWNKGIENAKNSRK